MPWRAIKPNHCSYRPRRIIFFDTETRPLIDPNDSSRVYNILRVGNAVFGRYSNGELTHRRDCTFYEPAGFWSFVAEQQSPRDTLWIVAHNLLFDLRIVRFDELFMQSDYLVDSPRAKRTEQRGKGVVSAGRPLAVLDDPPVIIGMRHRLTGSRLVCVDSFNWHKYSIAKLGEMISVPKLTMPTDDADEWQWLRYCRRDVEILEKTFCLLLKWCDDNKYGMFRYSAAGQAMSAYRHRFMHHKIITHDDAQVKQLERKSYFGGRSDVFRCGNYSGNFHQLDVNSLYPSVMRNNLFPTKLSRWEVRAEFLQLAPAINFANSIMEVVVNSPIERFPVRHNDRPIYAVGSFRCVLAGPELQRAISSGYVSHYGTWAEYEVAPIFDDYVKHFWGLRQQYKRDNNVVMDSLAKMMLNTLYGKFGQLAPEWQDVPDKIAEEPWFTWAAYDCQNDQVIEYRSIGWHVQKKVNREESSRSFPAISSFVTAYGRERMRQLRQTAGENNVWYQAVDSLIVNQIGNDKLQAAGEIMSGELGRMRLLRSADNINVLGVGDYSVGEHNVMVGRRKNAIIYADGSWSQAQFDGPGSLFTGTTRNHLCVQTIHKRRIKSYLGGNLENDGVVSPYALENPLVAGLSTESCSATIAVADESIASDSDSF